MFNFVVCSNCFHIKVHRHAVQQQQHNHHQQQQQHQIARRDHPMSKSFDNLRYFENNLSLNLILHLSDTFSVSSDESENFIPRIIRWLRHFQSSGFLASWVFYCCEFSILLVFCSVGSLVLLVFWFSSLASAVTKVHVTFLAISFLSKGPSNLIMSLYLKSKAKSRIE